MPKKTRPPSVARLSALDTLRPDAAGIDIGSDFHVVAVATADRTHVETRTFGACTADLEAMAAWLKEAGCTTAAMEATGICWIPLHDLLESKGIEAVLVDPRQVKAAPGRPKTDVLDAQRIRRLHSLGLLRGAFRPDEGPRVLRSCLRHRANLVRYAANHIQHMRKALEQMNVKLTESVSDITGKTGMGIIDAILAGQRDPKALAKLRDPRCKQDEASLARALEGTWRPEHLFELKQAVEMHRSYHQRIAECDRQIEEHLKTLADPEAGEPPAPKKTRQRRKGNGPGFDARTRLCQVAKVDLTEIEGIEAGTALVLLGEIGTDMSRWATSKKFCAWLGLCPNSRISGGKAISSGVRAGPNRAAQALRLAANSLQSSKSALGAFFRRIAARAGRAKAVTATAHKLGRLVYALLKHGQAYVSQGQEEYEKRYKERMVRHLERKAKEFGYELKAKQEQGQAQG